MILAAAIFSLSTLIVYTIGVGIEIILRNDIIWGRPRTVKQIVIGEIPSSILLGALIAAVIYIVRWRLG